MIEFGYLKIMNARLSPKIFTDYNKREVTPSMHEAVIHNTIKSIPSKIIY